MKQIALATFTLATLLSISGCTIAGFAVGAATDARQPKQEKTLRGEEIFELKKNTNITVFRKDAEPLKGSWQGVTSIALSKDKVVSGIILAQNRGSIDHYKIPFEHIDYVYVPARKAKGKIIGLAVGAAIDIGVIIISLNSLTFDFF